MEEPGETAAPVGWEAILLLDTHRVNQVHPAHPAVPGQKVAMVSWLSNGRDTKSHSCDYYNRGEQYLFPLAFFYKKRKYDR
jgi:hypothetical protein